MELERPNLSICHEDRARGTASRKHPVNDSYCWLCCCWYSSSSTGIMYIHKLDTDMTHNSLCKLLLTLRSGFVSIPRVGTKDALKYKSSSTL